MIETPLKERPFLLTGSGFDGTGYLTEESKLRKVHHPLFFHF